MWIWWLTFNPDENSTISSAWTFFKPYTRAMPSPMESTRPVSWSSADVSAPRIRSSRIEDTSAVPGRIQTDIKVVFLNSSGLNLTFCQSSNRQFHPTKKTKSKIQAGKVSIADKFGSFRVCHVCFQAIVLKKKYRSTGDFVALSSWHQIIQLQYRCRLCTCIKATYIY